MLQSLISGCMPDILRGTTPSECILQMQSKLPKHAQQRLALKMRMHARLRHTPEGSFWEQAIRTELKCTLPIEVTHHGKEEFNAKLVKMLEVRSARALLTLSSASLSPLSPGSDAAAL